MAIDQDRFAANTSLNVVRDGVERFDLYFSFSGPIILSGKLSELELLLDGVQVVISSPFRIGHPSFRSNPQLNTSNIAQLFRGFDRSFPLQVAAFPDIDSKGQAAVKVYSSLNESDKISRDDIYYPADSLKITVVTDQISEFEKKITDYVFMPLLAGLRDQTNQWWAGQPQERLSGNLHFLVPLGEKEELVGSPSPICRATTDIAFEPLTEESWLLATEYIKNPKIRPWRQLELEAYHSLASRNYLSGIVLACAAVESFRDYILERQGLKIGDFGTSTTDLLKHLTIGTEKLFSKNLLVDQPEVYEGLKALWIARGEAAHGKTIHWLKHGQKQRVEEVEFMELNTALRDVMNWLRTLAA